MRELVGEEALVGQGECGSGPGEGKGIPSP